MSSEVRYLLVADNSAGWDIQNFRLVKVLNRTSLGLPGIAESHPLTWVSMQQIVHPPLVVADERLTKLFQTTEPGWSYHSLPKRTEPPAELIEQIFKEEKANKMFRFSELIKLPCFKEGHTLLAGRPKPDRKGYLTAPQKKVETYVSQLSQIERELQKEGIFDFAYVVVSYDKPRSDIGVDEQDAYLQGRRQSLLVEDIASICAEVQRFAWANSYPFPIFISWQYGDKEREAWLALQASNKVGCKIPIQFLEGLDLNDDFVGQAAALLAIKQHSERHGYRTFALGNAATYQHLIGAVGYFDYHLVGLHSFPLSPEKDDRPYWLELGKIIHGCWAYQQPLDQPGNWEPVIGSMINKVKELIATESVYKKLIQ